MIWRILQSGEALHPDVLLEQFGQTVDEFDPRTDPSASSGLLDAELTNLELQAEEFETEVRRSHRETALLETVFVEYQQARELLRAVRPFSQQSDAPRDSLHRLAEGIAGLAQLVEQTRDEQDTAETWCRQLRHHLRVLRYKLTAPELASNDPSDISAEQPTGVDRTVDAMARLGAALEAMNQNAAEARANGAAMRFSAFLANLEQLAKDPAVASAVGLIRGSANSNNSAEPMQTGYATPSSQEMRLAAG